MAAQLKVLNAHLIIAGVPRTTAKRLFMFLRDWPDFDHVRIHAMAGVSPELCADMEAQLIANAPAVDPDTYQLRLLVIPGLPALQDKCP